jgi:LPXTG-motif cell wall-anchored protein
MKHIALVVVVAVLALAPSAAAKGPHALLSSGPEGIEPGRPWVATLTLMEFDGREVAAARPTVVLRSGSGDRFAVRPQRLGTHVPKHPDVLAEARYRLRVVFPRAGRWTYTVLDGTSAERRFRFPAATVGGGAERVTDGVTAFPKGSPEQASIELGYAPEPKLAAAPASAPDDEPGGGATGLWIPAAGLTLAGAGALTVLRRRRR